MFIHTLQNVYPVLNSILLKISTRRKNSVNNYTHFLKKIYLQKLLMTVSVYLAVLGLFDQRIGK